MLDYDEELPLTRPQWPNQARCVMEMGINTILPQCRCVMETGINSLTPSAELHSLTPAGHQVLSITLFHRCLHCHTVLCPGTQEPVASHCHGQRHGLGHKLGGDILRSGVQMENQASVLKSHLILALSQVSPLPPQEGQSF